MLAGWGYWDSACPGLPHGPLSWLLCNHWILESYGCHRLLEAGKQFLGPKRGGPDRPCVWREVFRPRVQNHNSVSELNSSNMIQTKSDDWKISCEELDSTVALITDEK